MENFFGISIPKNISVSGKLSQIIKLWVNLKSAILKYNALIPKAVIGEPCTVCHLAAVGCIEILKQSSIW